MTAPDVRVRKVLMIAGADYVHSVVFRQAQLLQKSNRYRFSAFGFGKPQGRPGNVAPSAIFEKFDPWPGPAGQPKSFKRSVQLLPHAARTLLAPRLPGDSLNWRDRALDSATNRISRSTFRRAVAGYDLYHWHCFAPDRLPLLKHLPRSGRVIVTLWGSDLYRTAGIREYSRQFEACHYATVFTMATPEMQTTFLAKFGQQWAGKTRLLSYGACNLDKIDRTHKKRDQILSALGIPAHTTIVSLGNSALMGNQHEAMLGAVKNLDSDLLGKLSIVVPMTYGAEPSYLQKVRELSRRLGTSVTILDKFLPDEAVSALRSATDIVVHVPISDQFSAAMCEALFAGSILITGSWLPYSRLRSNHVAFHEIATVPELTAKLTEVLRNFEIERARAQQNAIPIWEMMAWENVTPKWLALYDEVLNT